jgi:hypothetical protein
MSETEQQAEPTPLEKKCRRCESPNTHTRGCVTNCEDCKLEYHTCGD